ncbi:MAG: dienelactone hydrolase family protein [Propionibacteriaceae bacterium]|jgi:carboxymethylenebutenolidase|nr:dienelactone hydrolase family protein [Propionibacteriaceae bacterium]
MWNDLQTDAYEGMLAETVTLPGAGGDRIHAYLSRPLGPGPYPGIVLVPHLPGWDELNREVARRFTQHGFTVVCPNIYERFGHGRPTEVAQRARESGGVPDTTVMGDCAGALDYLKTLPTSNDRVGVIGMCSGGRHAFLAACTIPGFDAAVDCWGARVIAAPETLTPAQPVAAIDFTADLACPLLGIFGNDDQFPTPAEVDRHQAELERYGKTFEFHRYDGAGHAMWNHAGESYRPVQVMDAWNKVLAFFAQHLGGHG